MTDAHNSVEACLVTVEELRSMVLRAHEDRVGRLCGAFCMFMGMDEGFAEAMRYAGGLHDVGKVAIPDAILSKPSRLDADEWKAMCRHVALGHDILGRAGMIVTDLAAIVALNHHEYWDGTGYPDGLVGEKIPEEARIVTLCDVYAALRESRSYKPIIHHDDALHMMLVGSEDRRTRPELFDPDLLAAFARNADKIRDFYDAH